MKLCRSCIGEPRGVEGHPALRMDLFADAESEKPVSVFFCDNCNTTWRRVYAGDGQFEWKRLDGAYSGQ